MTLMTDIDEVLCRTVEAVLAAIMRRWKLPPNALRLSDVTEWNMHRSLARKLAGWGVDSLQAKQHIEALWADMDFYAGLEPYPIVCRELRETHLATGYELHFITARPPAAHAVTVAWLKRCLGYDVEVVGARLHMGFSGPERLAKVLDVAPDTYTDDDAAMCRAVYEANPDIVCSIPVRPWNKPQKPAAPMSAVVYSGGAILPRH